MTFTRLTTSIGIITLPGVIDITKVKALGIEVHSVQTLIITNRNAG